MKRVKPYCHPPSLNQARARAVGLESKDGPTLVSVLGLGLLGERALLDKGSQGCFSAERPRSAQRHKDAILQGAATAWSLGWLQAHSED